MARAPQIPTENRFDKALQYARKSRCMSQEQFDVVSSRTYVSSLERGMKSPTIKKVDSLAAVMQVHPVTLLALAYLQPGDPAMTGALMERVQRELQDLGAL